MFSSINTIKVQQDEYATSRTSKIECAKGISPAGMKCREKQSVENDDWRNTSGTATLDSRKCESIPEVVASRNCGISYVVMCKRGDEEAKRWFLENTQYTTGTRCRNSFQRACYANIAGEGDLSIAE